MAGPFETREVNEPSPQDLIMDWIQEHCESPDPRTIPPNTAQFHLPPLLLDEDKSGSSPTKSAIADAQTTEPEKTVLHDPDGTIMHKEWTSGSHKGEKDDAFEDGTEVHAKSDGGGGEIVEHTDSKGYLSIDHARPDGKAGVVVEHNGAIHSDAYTANYSPDGSMKVDWKDGRHLERYTDAQGITHTTMRGPNGYDNFTATESKGEQRVQYADGTSYERQDGKVTKHGKYGLGGVLDYVLSSSSESHQITFGQLNAAFWMSQSQAVEDVRRGQANPTSNVNDVLPQ